MKKVKTIENLVSVVIANYNNAKYLKDAVESVLNQTYKNIEIIIADDSSTDNSMEIIKDYCSKDERIRAVIQKVNSGVAINRNSAIAASRGEFICTLDSDDIFYDKYKLEKELKIVKSGKDKFGYNLIAFSSAMLLDEKGRRIGKRSAEKEIQEGDLFDHILLRKGEIPLNFLAHRNAYIAVGGYDPQLKIYEDWDLKLRLAACYKFKYTGLVGTGIRMHGKGLSSSPLEEQLIRIRQVFEKNHDLSKSDLTKNRIEFEKKLKKIEQYLKSKENGDSQLKKIIKNIPIVNLYFMRAKHFLNLLLR